MTKITTVITKNDGKRRLPFDEPRLVAFIHSATHAYPHLNTKQYTDKVIRTITQGAEYKAEQITNLLIMTALENIDMGRPDWTYVAAYVHLRQLYKQAAKNRVYDASKKYGDFYSLLTTLTNKGVYSSLILESYTKDEIRELGEIIAPERDKLFTYVGLKLLSTRYLAKHNKAIYELPQERLLIIAMHVMAKEPKDNRLDLVKESYWAQSNLYMTVATPTLSNAGKSYGQLSSCFIDTIDDSLQGIFDTNTDIANVSKGGGGVGLYIGKVRAEGSDIRGNKGASGGTIPWMKIYNQTAVGVDQLGQRKGAIAIYQDAWHKDILAFLDSKLTNGDERLRAHDIFTGVCLPDLFMEQVKKRGDWYLFDPHEVRTIMGFSLEDFYDEKKGEGSFREHYELCVQSNELPKVRIPAIEIMKRIMTVQLEEGVPYMFYRDEVNRKNPNKHAGMIYCSNLCTEIDQNMSATKIEEIKVEGGKIIITKIPGDFVVCNLSSINLPRAVGDKVLERLIPIQVRMLDNVIDLNDIGVMQAEMTNQKYRAVGLGTFGWHHLLAQKGIYWESDAAVRLADELYEDIAFLTIQASADLSKEKGAYPVFVGSEWQTGEYFESRGYLTDYNGRWFGLASQIAEFGIRNGYLQAVAPNAKTALIGGSTNGIDPLYDIEYNEENSDFSAPVTAPDISPENYEFYKRNRYVLDQHWSIKQNAARQRHIDQGVSFNLYVHKTILAKDLLALHLDAWESGFKTTYYVRSTAISVEECEWCSS
ncbi:ribonucleoside-diphosphate reductase subunit alpha [Peribacillus huizhouensis]|uniref:Ribonucleoside-diphosphate reductase n=1 Tax=Peribacillus huizhouensis TaxID=1501239 RepID=A0ABR6CSG6_9BACI|nr:ribonucleoside-diphosphate reductase subunit alpha [Peribacillus huizhouensis]MBA9027555.1 ribonucleoside-diphosphate reductase alpha chain [Peribacillus huizhouensis]